MQLPPTRLQPDFLQEGLGNFRQIISRIDTLLCATLDIGIVGIGRYQHSLHLLDGNEPSLKASVSVFSARPVFVLELSQIMCEVQLVVLPFKVCTVISMRVTPSHEWKQHIT